MTTRSRIIWFVAAWILLIAVAYSPTLLYVAHSLGFGLARSELNGLHFKLGKWWVPVLSPGSALQPLFGRKSKEMVVLVKAGGLLPGIRERIAISQIGGSPETAIRNAKEVSLSIGKAYVVTEPSDHPGQEHFIIKEHNLLITAAGIGPLHEIKTIHKSNK